MSGDYNQPGPPCSCGRRTYRIVHWYSLERYEGDIVEQIDPTLRHAGDGTVACHG